ncbi:TIGR02281 family clan AA aspartic protease [Thauera butanivorans]|uniref:TIGR02281 family clan AA aspartic protease n=1 Tax=Thauera butanivorans TaxID=86174 RepID=UPI0008395FC3|nr:TIGR02281 family clan AA aspartic protease [Thauera butanivorans]
MATLRRAVAVALAGGGGLLMMSSSAFALDLALAGLFATRAVIVVDGGTPQTLAIGASTREGVKLLAVQGEVATVEVNGRRQALRLGEHAVSVDSVAAPVRVMIEGDSQGHFVAQGSVNGASMRFLVDTGATAVSMGAADARRAGIDFRQGRQAYSQTANGVAPIWIVRLNSVRLGGIELAGVDAAIHEGDMPVVLLGMSFLNRMQMSREGNRLILERRY